MGSLHYRAIVGQSLCDVVERDPALRDAGVILADHGEGEILRHPAKPDDPYIYCSAGPSVALAAPRNPVDLEWRAPPSRKPRPAHPTAKPSEKPDTLHDAINLGLDIAVLGIGVALIAATGGAAIGVWAGVQLAAGGIVAANDAARLTSDYANGGRLGRTEDASNLYSEASIVALGVQVVDGEGLLKLGQKPQLLLKSPGISAMFSASRDFADARAALQEANSGFGEALRGNIGPGQRVRLGKLLDLGGRRVKIQTIRAALALKIANDFGSTLITLGQASWGGPLDGLRHAFPAFQLSLLFTDDSGTSKVRSFHEHGASHTMELKRNDRK